MSSTTLIYNVVALHGEKESLNAIEEHYIRNHAARNGYLFNIRDWTTGWDNIAQTKRYIQLGKQFVNNAMLSLNKDNELTDTTVNDLRQDIVKYICRLSSRIVERNGVIPLEVKRILDYSTFTLNDLHHSVESVVNYNPNSGWVSQEGMDNCLSELAKFHPSLSEMVISTESNQELIDVEDDEYIYRTEEEWFWINYHCKPLFETDFENYLNDIEDTQSHVRLDDNTLLFSTWSKSGDVSHLIADLCGVYSLTATILSGNRKGSREMKINDQQTCLVLRTLRTEIPLQRCIEFLEPLAQLDNCIHWFGWTEKDVYPDMDDETYIATMPVGGLD